MALYSSSSSPAGGGFLQAAFEAAFPVGFDKLETCPFLSISALLRLYHVSLQPGVTF
jgi:hypothetical protein